MIQQRADLRELECFLAVAEHLNFSRAARSMHLSQPPLTRHIQSLEGKLGVRLLERSTHAVSLTGAGRLYLEDARAILSLLDRAAETVRRVQAGAPSRLRLAFVGALLDDSLVRLFQRFRVAHPDCQLQITDLAPAMQLEAIRAGELDGGLIGALPPRGGRDLKLTVWREEELLLALPGDHLLAARSRVDWKLLRDEPWVMVSRAAAPAFRQQFSVLCGQTGLGMVKVVQESERVTAILTMVAAGAGITLVPESVTHLITQGVVFRKMTRPTPRLQHTFAYRSALPSPPLRDFLKLLTKGVDSSTQ